MAVDHYENFPVASILLPRRLVPAVEAIYAFARSADDLADEGQATPDERLAALDAYERELDGIAAGDVRGDFYMRSAPQPTATQSGVASVGRRLNTS